MFDNKPYETKNFHDDSFDVRNYVNTFHGLFEFVGIYLHGNFFIGCTRVQLFFCGKCINFNFRTNDLHATQKKFFQQQTFANLFWSWAISGLAVLSLGNFNAWLFLICFLPFNVIGTVVRPFGMKVLLNKAKENVGNDKFCSEFICKFGNGFGNSALVEFY